MKGASKSLLAAAAVSGLLAIASFAAAAGLVPAVLRSAIIVRSVGYESGFAGRSGEAVIAVVTGKAGPSASDGGEVVAVLGKLVGSTKIAGRRVRVVQVTHESSAKTASEVDRHRAEVVYVSSGLESVIRQIPVKVGGAPRVIVCAQGADVGRGCTLGVELDGEKPRLVLDLKQANAAGLRFQPAFLRLARIVR
jgi:hypothetical protein